MDATCEQRDGFRFFYLLPWSERELLIEDTRYSATPDVDVEAYRDEILSYAARRHWRVAAETYREVGVLPIPLSAHFTTEGNVAEKMRRRRVGAIGTRAGFFHATTGYSVPHAARVAEALASLDDFSPEIVSECLATAAEENEARGSFYRLLNRMLIRGASPDARYRVLERFYGLPEPLVARFYAMRLTAADGLRLLVGKPPIPIHRAIRCLWERGTHAYA
jgi:lycopene beta-cyclase